MAGMPSRPLSGALFPHSFPWPLLISVSFPSDGCSPRIRLSPGHSRGCRRSLPAFAPAPPLAAPALLPRRTHRRATPPGAPRHSLPWDDATWREGEPGTPTQAAPPPRRRAPTGGAAVAATRGSWASPRQRVRAGRHLAGGGKGTVSLRCRMRGAATVRRQGVGCKGASTPPLTYPPPAPPRTPVECCRRRRH